MHICVYIVIYDIHTMHVLCDYICIVNHNSLPRTLAERNRPGPANGRYQIQQCPSWLDGTGHLTRQREDRVSFAALSSRGHDR